MSFTNLAQPRLSRMAQQFVGLKKISLKEMMDSLGIKPGTNA
jgi:hypothetical protein